MRRAMTAPVSKHRPVVAPAKNAATDAPPKPATADAGAAAQWAPKAGARKAAGAAPSEQALADTMRSLSTATPRPLHGAKGQDVTQLQRALHAVGYSLDADGAWGPKTDTALQAFAHNNKLQLGPKGALSPAVASALALKLEGSAVSAAVTRVSNTFMSANPRFFSEAEDAFRSIEAEKDPAKKQQLLTGWVDSTSRVANEHGAALSQLQPDWAQDWSLISRHIKELGASGNGKADLQGDARRVLDRREEPARLEHRHRERCAAQGRPEEGRAVPQHHRPPRDRRPEEPDRGQRPGNVHAPGRGQGRAEPAAQRAARLGRGTESTALDAQRTGGFKPLADFMRETFVRHTLEAVKPSNGDPAKTEADDRPARAAAGSSRPPPTRTRRAR